MKLAAIPLLFLLFFFIVDAIVVLQTSASPDVATSLARNMRLKVVDAAGDPIPDIQIQLQRIAGTEELTFIPGGVSDDKGIFICTLSDGTYQPFLSTQGKTLVISPHTFEVSQDAEIIITAHLIHLKPPSPGGLFEIDGIHTTLNFSDPLNVGVDVLNYYGVGKNVTIEVWIQDSSSNRLSAGIINENLENNETYRMITLTNPPLGWASGYYQVHGRVYDKIVYSENSITVKLEVVVPFWMDWRVWLIITITIGVFGGTAYFFKKTKLTSKSLASL